MGTGIQEKQQGNDDRHQRWARLERADLFAQYGDLQVQGLSQRQAAQMLEVPRSTLQAWRAYPVFTNEDASLGTVYLFSTTESIFVAYCRNKVC